ncbi:MAG: SAM-dependent methyltransferase [Theionarchaea archaeon]|nr:SAM-dependent methyltransferase [Theionarchaea archaeon]
MDEKRLHHAGMVGEGSYMPNDSTKKAPVSQSLIKIVQFIVFLIIQIPLLPLAIIGFVIAAVKELLYSKKLGISATAIEPLNVRWGLHYFRSREDKWLVKLIKALPTGSHYGLLCFYGPAIIANRICGYTPKLATIPAPGKETLSTFVNSRTAFFDRIMEKNIAQMNQVVFMGAGFDTRAFKYCKGKNVKVFELDQENTQKYKIEALRKAGIDYEWITFVPIDFRQESWVDKLMENGFDTVKKTFFFWEGVTGYLEEESVKQTLKAVAKSSGKGSVITFDIYAKSLIAGTGESSFIMKYYGKPLVKMFGEPFIFGIDTTKNPRENVETLLREAGLTLGEFSLLGKTTEKVKPFGGLVEAVK